MVDSGASWGKASAPGGVGVGGHDRALRPSSDGGTGLWKRCQGAMNEAPDNVVNVKNHTKSPEQTEKRQV